MKPLSERQVLFLLTIALWGAVVLVAIVSVFIARHLLADQTITDFPPPVHRFYYATWIGAFCAWRLIWGRVPLAPHHFKKASLRMLVLLTITVWMSLMYFAAVHNQSPRVIATELSNLLFVFVGFGISSLALLVVVFCFDDELEQFLRSVSPLPPAAVTTHPAASAVVHGLDSVNMAQLGVYNSGNGIKRPYELWYLLKDLQTYGHIYLAPHRCDLWTLARALQERGYVMYCGQEVPVFPMRGTAGELIGIELRIGRVPPQFVTI